MVVGAIVVTAPVVPVVSKTSSPVVEDPLSSSCVPCT